MTPLEKQNKKLKRDLEYTKRQLEFAENTLDKINNLIPDYAKANRYGGNVLANVIAYIIDLKSKSEYDKGKAEAQGSETFALRNLLKDMIEKQMELNKTLQSRTDTNIIS